MKGILVGLAVVGLTVGGGWLVMNRNKLGKIQPSVQPPRVSMPSSNILSGIVKGVSSIDTTPVQNVAKGVINTATQIGTVLGVQTVPSTQQTTSNAPTSAATSSGVINVGSVVENIKSQMSNLPATLAKQAQVEYCKQVLNNQE